MIYYEKPFSSEVIRFIVRHFLLVYIAGVATLTLVATTLQIFGVHN